jgi:hypothetical protein
MANLHVDLIKSIVETTNISILTDTVKEDIDKYLDNATLISERELAFTDWDDVVSVNITFDAVLRTATASADDAELITNILWDTTLTSDADLPLWLRGLIYKGTGSGSGVIYFVSVDGGVTFFSIVGSYDLVEKLEGQIVLKIVLATTGDVASGVDVFFEPDIDS